MRKSINNNFTLLLAETSQHLTEARLNFTKPSAKIIYTFKNRKAYITNLADKTQIKIFNHLLKHSDNHQNNLNFKVISSICSRLTKIADLALNIMQQAMFLEDPLELQKYDLNIFFEQISSAFLKIKPALDQKEINLALKICNAEKSLDLLYKDRRNKLLKAFQPNRNPNDLVISVMIAHYLERIGDILLEIGEQIISLIIGEKLKFTQYQALIRALKRLGYEYTPDKLRFNSIWSGRSGCRIGIINNQLGRENVLFKHGVTAKIEQEQQNLKYWAKLRPGICPNIKAFLKNEKQSESSLIMEFLPSQNLKELFLAKHYEEANSGLQKALELMLSLWHETLTDSEVNASFARQAEKRLSAVGSMHPEPVYFSGSIGSFKIKSFQNLLKEVKLIESFIPNKFSVRIHGDFNLGNVLYSIDKQQIHLIDLYRSIISDYIQDISVMIISILRLPVRSKSIRLHLINAAHTVVKYAHNFALSINDKTMPARLTLGLARSFFTSARFEPRSALALDFILKSRYLWENIIAYHHQGKPWENFIFNENVLT